MVKKGKTKEVDNQIFKDYLKKAQDFHAAIQLCMDNSNWNAVGLNAVHAAISASDSLLAKMAGLRSMDSSHSAVADLIEKFISDDDVKKQSTRLRRILGLKNLIEYEGRNFYQREAEDLQRDVDRYFSWVKKMLQKGL